MPALSHCEGCQSVPHHRAHSLHPVGTTRRVSAPAGNDEASALGSFRDVVVRFGANRVFC